MMSVQTICDDPRTILSVWWDSDEETPYYRLGHNGVTSIRAYKECGNGAMVPWLAVYKGEHLAARLNISAIGCHVLYQEPAE